MLLYLRFFVTNLEIFAHHLGIPDILRWFHLNLLRAFLLWHGKNMNISSECLTHDLGNTDALRATACIMSKHACDAASDVLATVAAFSWSSLCG